MKSRDVFGVRVGPTKSQGQSPEASRQLCRCDYPVCDPLARIFEDEFHSADEPREMIVGHSRAKRLLLVCFTEWEIHRVRIISARPATRKELHDYEEHAKG